VTQFWAEHAWLGADLAEAGVVITVADGKIAAVVKGVMDPPGEAMRLDGLTLPGFANGHSHAFHRLLRGRTHAGSGSFWTWREEMYAAAATLDPDDYHQIGLQVFGEMVAAGYSAVGEFHYLHHGADGTRYENRNIMGDALIAAATAVGIRITLLDTLYLHGGIDESGEFADLDAVQRRFSDGSAESWAERVAGLSEGPTLRIGAAVHSVRAADRTAIEAVATWAREANAPFHAHVSEQPAENTQSQAAFGLSPTQLLAEAGALGTRFTAVHGTHLDDRDIALLGSSSSNVCFCPTTERDLADGIGPGRSLVKAGARLSIGSDSQAIVDPFEEIRAVELNERLATQVRGNHSVHELLTYGTANGYAAIGWPEGGRIEVGALADFTTITLDSFRLEGTAPAHLLASAVFAATASDVTTTVVDGQIVHTD